MFIHLELCYVIVILLTSFLGELLTQEEPFPDIETFEDMIERGCNIKNYFNQAVCMQHERPPIPEDAPPTFKKLIGTAT